MTIRLFSIWPWTSSWATMFYTKEVMEVPSYSVLMLKRHRVLWQKSTRVFVGPMLVDIQWQGKSKCMDIIWWLWSDITLSMWEGVKSVRCIWIELMLLQSRCTIWWHLGHSHFGASIWLVQSTPRPQMVNVSSLLLSIILLSGWKPFALQCHPKAFLMFLKVNIMYCYRLPERIITYKAPKLKDAKVRKLCEQFKIKHHKSMPYLPQMNGVVEAANKKIKTSLRKWLSSLSISMKRCHMLYMGIILLYTL